MNLSTTVDNERTAVRMVREIYLIRRIEDVRMIASVF